MATKKKTTTTTRQLNFVVVTTTEIQAANMTDATEVATKQGLINRVAIIEVDDKGDGRGGIISEDFAAIMATVMG